MRYLVSHTQEKFSALEYFSIRYGALIHDAGKTQIPLEILTKPDKLSEEEFNIIKKHPIFGYEMLKDSLIPSDSLNVVLYHHERKNGGGYPIGLIHNTIPRGARIVAIVDVFEALLGKRPYPRPHDNIKNGETRMKKALEMITTMANNDRLYLPYVELFVDYIHSLEEESSEIEGPIDKNHQAALNFYKSITKYDKELF